MVNNLELILIGTDEDESEEEEANTANTAKQTANNTNENCSAFKRFKASETEEIVGFGAISEPKESTKDFTVFSQGSREFTDDLPSTKFGSVADFLSVGEALATLFNGTLTSKEAQNGRGGSKGLRFCCSNSHEFTISFEKLDQLSLEELSLESCKNIWCVKCHNFYYRCLKKAEENNAAVTSKIFDKGHVQLTCRMNHQFKISIHRNPDKVWCQSCKKDVKSESRKQIERDNELKRLKEYEHQKQLFEESKKHVETNSTQNAAGTGYTMQYILEQVELKADYETKKFITSGTANMNESSVFQVYKVIYMPSEILQAFFKSTGEGLNSCFRKMAVLIHPDKNSHPLANQAFQKLSQAFQNASRDDSSS